MGLRPPIYIQLIANIFLLQRLNFTSCIFFPNTENLPC